MSTITTETGEYLTYILTDGDSQVAVVPERGGIVTSWQVQGKDVFYLDAERFKDPSLSVRGGFRCCFLSVATWWMTRTVSMVKPISSSSMALGGRCPGR